MDALYYNGFKLAYRRYGASDAPAVVLIMGLGMSSAVWPTSLIAHLVREGFQVITPDNRDCGESSRCTDMKADGRNVASAVAQALLRRKVTSAYALEDMALDVERLLNYLSIRRAHIVGISMGGMIAQVAAVQSPNRVASLTSIASAGQPENGIRSSQCGLDSSEKARQSEYGGRTEGLLRPRVHHPFRAGVQAVGRGTREHAGHAGEPALRS